MPDLTGKQRRFLRAAGQRLPPAVFIGKAGADDDVLSEIRRRLDRRELIKVRLPEGLDDRRAFAAALAEAVGARCAGVTGRSALFYRPNPRLPDADHIQLP